MEQQRDYEISELEKNLTAWGKFYKRFAPIAHWFTILLIIVALVLSLLGKRDLAASLAGLSVVLWIVDNWLYMLQLDSIRLALRETYWPPLGRFVAILIVAGIVLHYLMRFVQLDLPLWLQWVVAGFIGIFVGSLAFPIPYEFQWQRVTRAISSARMGYVLTLDRRIRRIIEGLDKEEQGSESSAEQGVPEGRELSAIWQEVNQIRNGLQILADSTHGMLLLDYRRLLASQIQRPTRLTSWLLATLGPPLFELLRVAVSSIAHSIFPF